MTSPEELESFFREAVVDLPLHLPDGLYEVNLTLLQDLGIFSDEEESDEDLLSHSFYVLESEEKLTLFNEKFAIWIFPQMQFDIPITYTLIALNDLEGPPRLEMGFTNTGAYNNSSLVLRVLEKFLGQIEENESEIFKFKES